MITEGYMQQGSYTVPLLPTAPLDLLEQIVEFGHVVILDEWAEPGQFTDAGLLALARYAGPVLELDWQDRGFKVAGAGMVWHLGDGKAGPPIETAVTFSAAALTTVLSSSGLLPAAVTAGTITTTGLNTYSGFHQWQTPLEAIRTVMQTLGAHFRVNPDGTLDASAVTASSGNPYNTTPNVFVVRRGWGADGEQIGLRARRLRTHRDARRYVTEAVLIQETDTAGYYEKVDSEVRASLPYKDIHGNALDRVALVRRPASQDVDLDAMLSGELDQRDINDQQTIDTDQYELGQTDYFKVGDMFHIYDPPSGFVDMANPQYFRGELLWPKTTRLLEATWPVSRGMGIYYRDAAGAYLDLTRWVQWEAE